LKTALADGEFAFDHLAGSGNLTYKLSLLRAQLCQYKTFLDYDDAGRRAEERARKEGLLSVSDSTFARCLGMPDSEVEDLYDVDLYREELESAFQVHLGAPTFKNPKSKWTDRVAATFAHAGRPWDDRVRRDVKKLVSECVARSPSKAIHQSRAGPVLGLIAVLEQNLKRP
jgi:hypothetical protein